ncbi:DinB family protein [Spirosoma soli]|uniref:DinB family protein n=1 Tax=Spirosoma soli TaxID=1770529 RepID=A0ABW5MFU6_9BACT
MRITKESIKSRLLSDCHQFVDTANSYSQQQFNHNPAGKWSVADVTQHLYLSARPVVRLMTGPRGVLTQWGEPDGPSRSYAVIESLYRTVLNTGVKAPASMSPRPDDLNVGQADVLERFSNEYYTLAQATKSWSEQELDSYVMPHPALGKLTVREMLSFVSIHTQHHLALLPIN